MLYDIGLRKIFLEKLREDRPEPRRREGALDDRYRLPRISSLEISQHAKDFHMVIEH
jgi:hypothetical protein